MRFVAAVLSVALAGTPAAQLVCVLRDPQITEASGLGVSRLHPGVLYVHNDSGDTARFFAVSAGAGATVATFTVPDAENVDWEDLAVAGGGSTASVYLADIGDNAARRDEVDVYRVPEPSAVRSGATAAAEVWRLRYPSGPVNAEALAVTPGGAGYIVTKATDGRSEVYTLPSHPDRSRVQTLRRVASFPVPGASRAARDVTGASFSADGTVLAVRTYTDAYLWHVRDADVATALRHAPVRMRLPLQLQGEGVAVDGDRLLLDSEGVHSAVLAVPLPAQFRTGPPASSAAATGGSPGTSSSAPSRLPPSRTLGRGLELALAAAAAVSGLALLAARRRRRR